MAKKDIKTYSISEKDRKRMREHLHDYMKRPDTPKTQSVNEFYAKELHSGNVPDFYSQGKGYFGENFGGYMPAEVNYDLVPFFGGDLLRVVGGDAYEGYFAPLNDEYNNLIKEAMRSKELDKVSRDYKRAGSSYGLHPFKRKKSTPFTIDRGRLAAFFNGGEGDKSVDIGDRI